ncbi:MAG: S-adenosylmethionine:tRNA ribosyltransferase-isomerase [Candidatus Uhrbacteria bacterium GW2011_GWD2_52_7]|uniref:S-adenosylmethionine:tRNA ribosyltransferase-isomerase n=1 Tax=Candidatus Uhrbacteria bacterium GW2011_GWD2_52_7 TaxID=1618989 RepID=A0A0G1XHN4_9BACT|nr:MAG: S-adenosylmethionine:tRNA ribosyltransferase-isomerase [Candidatus Uhrbacteria bacterium GW2011_GWD2_52_7]
MKTSIDLFDYDLPASFIAQASVEPRDHSRLLVLDKQTGEVAHRRFYEVADMLAAGDVLVFNVSKVFRARLRCDGVEMFVLKIRDGEAECLLRPGKKFAVGSTVSMFGRGFLVCAKHDGVVWVKTEMTADEMLAFCNAHGEIPTPPYVQTAVTDDAKYQNVYAKTVGSVAAPTAGFHFTPELLETLRAKGVQIEEVTLHVGIGTFRPVQTQTIEEHEMHSEWVEVSDETALHINEAKRAGRRVIAVGTTSTRVLEGVTAKFGELRGYQGEINIFITPGFSFQIIDGLITNFHLPKSTLLMLVSALAGRERVLAAYEAAKVEGYRFFSFGDAMFIQ